MVAIGTQGGIDTAAAIVGNWSNVDFIAPSSPYNGSYSIYNIGNFEEGVLELSREDYIHVGTALPQVADYVVPVKAGMKFSGQATEFHKILLHALIGDAIGNSSNYIYPGVQTCSNFFTVRARRRRACDGVVLEAKLFRVRGQGAIQIGSAAAEGVRTPVELEALDDQANTMYQGGSASAPLGYFWVPDAISGVSENEAAGA